MSMQKALEEMIRRVSGVVLVVGDVTAVDRDKLAIDVKPVDGTAPFLAVSLRASLDGGTTAVVQMPTTGSRVIIGVLGNSQAVLLAATAVTEVLMEVDGGGYLKLEPQVTRIDARAIEVGNQDLQPAVKGDNLESRLGDVLDQFNATLNALMAFASAMAAAATGPLAPLALAPTTLNGALALVGPQVAIIQGLLPQIKSQKVKIE